MALWRWATTLNKQELASLVHPGGLGDGTNIQLKLDDIRAVVRNLSSDVDLKGLIAEIRTRCNVTITAQSDVHYSIKLNHGFRLVFAQAPDGARVLVTYIFGSNHHPRGTNKKEYEEVLSREYRLYGKGDYKGTTKKRKLEQSEPAPSHADNDSAPKAKRGKAKK